MTQQQENLSAFIDGESGVNNDELIDALKPDSQLTEKWHRYHMIRDGLRGELGQSAGFDIASAVADAIEHEPAILAPKKRLRDIPILGSVIPLVRQSGQYLAAASVAAVVILGVQNFNQREVTEPFTTAPPVLSIGGLAPVSLEQTRDIPRNDMSALLEQRRLINALIADHQRQLQSKGTVEPNVEQNYQGEGSNQPQQPE